MSEWTEDDDKRVKKIKNSKTAKRVELVLSDDTTLGEARELLRTHIQQGVLCPCCNSLNKVYARGIHWKSGVWLCQLVRRYLGEARWYQVQEFYDIRGGDYAKLRYWGLAQLKPQTDYDTRTSGLWRPTEKGIQFAKGMTKIPEKILVYQGVYQGTPENVRMVSIHQVLHGVEGKFSWSETMAPVVDTPL